MEDTEKFFLIFISISSTNIILHIGFVRPDARNAPPRINEKPNDKIWKVTETRESSQCKSLKLIENLSVTKV